jgi:4,5-DOPA dioxygenase extradiol
MRPRADAPTFELSLNMTAPPETHWGLGRRLAPLGERGVPVIGSGNIVHSFAGVSWEPSAQAHAWAEQFDAWVAASVARHDGPALVGYQSAGAAARLAVPTTDHYLPLLYVAAVSSRDDPVTFPYVGIEMASMSMRCVRLGRVWSPMRFATPFTKEIP